MYYSNIKYKSKRVNLDLVLADEKLQKISLAELKKLLQSNNKRLKDSSSMPQPDISLISNGHNRLIQDELDYDILALVVEYEKLMSSMTLEQKGIYKNKCSLFFHL